MIFTTTTQKKYKQAYKQHIDKLYPVYQSKKIDINGESYVLVGQIRMAEQQLFTDFDVFNTDAESADEDIGNRIHEFISRLMITEQMLGKVKASIEKLMKEDVQTQFIQDNFPLIEEHDVYQLAQPVTMIHEKIDSLIDLVSNLLKQQYWDETSVVEIENKWSSFMEAYENRAYILLKWHAQQSNEIEEKISSAIDQASLLRKEAEAIYDVYQIATPQKAELGSFSIDKWITHNYEYGRFRRNDEPMKKKYKFERGLYTFVVYLYRFAVWFFIPLILLVLISDGELTFGSAMPLISFGIVGSVIKNQNKSQLLKKVNADIVNRRAITH